MPRRKARRHDVPYMKDVEYPNLTCPYTGAQMEIMFDDNLKRVGFYVGGGFDPALPFFSEEEAVAALSRRAGGKTATKLVCPYTGAPMALEQRKTLWFATGGFHSPGRHYKMKEDALIAISTRDGVAPAVHVPFVRVIDHPEHGESNPAAGAPDASDVAAEAAERFVEGLKI